MKQSNSVRGWQGGLGSGLALEIEAAIEQYFYDVDYEASEPKLAQTLKDLSELSRHADALLDLLPRLSPVAVGAIYEAANAHGYRIGRYELAELLRLLRGLPKGAAESPVALPDADRRTLGAGKIRGLAIAARRAATELRQRHSPSEDEGQGSGSAVGRDSDLRAVPADIHPKVRFHLRSPKEKLGLKVIRACLRHPACINILGRGGASRLAELLERIWAEVEPGTPTSWKRIVELRHQVSEFDDGVRRIRVSRRSQKRNATS